MVSIVYAKIPIIISPIEKTSQQHWLSSRSSYFPCKQIVFSLLPFCMSSQNGSLDSCMSHPLRQTKILCPLRTGIVGSIFAQILLTSLCHALMTARCFKNTRKLGKQEHGKLKWKIDSRFVILARIEQKKPDQSVYCPRCWFSTSPTKFWGNDPPSNSLDIQCAAPRSWSVKSRWGQRKIGRAGRLKFLWLNFTTS